MPLSGERGQRSFGEMVSIDLKEHWSDIQMEANGAIAVGGNFYGALDGKISATVSGAISGPESGSDRQRWRNR